jgi:hypothetical protein
MLTYPKLPLRGWRDRYQMFEAHQVLACLCRNLSSFPLLQLEDKNYMTTSGT